MYKKPVSDDLLSIDVFWLNMKGYFEGYRSGGIQWSHGYDSNRSSIGLVGNIKGDNPHVRLIYAHTDWRTGIKESLDYRVAITGSVCNFGGLRYWFICPLSTDGETCGRRVATLYKVGKYFGCRTCHRVTYDTRNTSRRFRGLERFFQADRKLEKLSKLRTRDRYAGKPTKSFLRRRQLLHEVMVADSLMYSLNL
jgi:hypothetical protein